MWGLNEIAYYYTDKDGKPVGRHLSHAGVISYKNLDGVEFPTLPFNNEKSKMVSFQKMNGVEHTIYGWGSILHTVLKRQVDLQDYENVLILAGMLKQLDDLDAAGFSKKKKFVMYIV